jgi:hypothetical protein
MKAQATALLLADLGVTRSHNRPHTSNDNPGSRIRLLSERYSDCPALSLPRLWLRRSWRRFARSHPMRPN